MSTNETVIAEFRERIIGAKKQSACIRIRGGGSKDFHGVSLEGDLLETKDFTGITEYEPTELVLTARSGTPLRDIEHTLNENNQMLPFDPPHMGLEATFGGCIASGFSGPRRSSQGAVRDFVLGARILNSDAVDLQFGGKVMKNVAGFDVSRLLTGSFGTLGLILESSVKVLPKPEMERTLFFELDHESALAKMNALAGTPIPLSSTYFNGNQLAVRLSGSEIGVTAAHKKIGGELGEVPSFWTSVKEQTHPFFKAEGCLYRLSVNPTAPMDRYSDALIEWNGSTRWIWNNGTLSDHQKFASQYGGYATIYRGNQSGDPINSMAPALKMLQRKIKNSLDPDGIFGKKRLFTEF
ncbi:glycolate oxidase subunit GlcE [Burkholderiales bacterium]|nr:glycolate oxidase subunit GlcE [Burkholderiales bacterium]